jgi:hypothetical protein
MRILFLLFVASLAMAQSPTLQKGRQILADFRIDRPVSSVRIPAATQRSVLSKVFRRYLTDENKCSSQFNASDATDPLAAARKAGQIVPSILDVINGSFTAAGQTQTAYLISVSECNASHADNFGTKRMAIFSGQQLVADVDVDFNSSIIRKIDLNSDGIDELLMTGGDMHQGEAVEMASLITLQNSRFRVIHDFGTVMNDDCAAVRPSSSVKASVLYISDILLGRMPKLTMDNYVSGCRKTRRWRFVSSGKMQ